MRAALRFWGEFACLAAFLVVPPALVLWASGSWVAAFVLFMVLNAGVLTAAVWERG